MLVTLVALLGAITVAVPISRRLGLGSILAHQLDHSTVENAADLPGVAPAMETLGLTHEQLVELTNQGREEIDELLKLFQSAAAK